MFKLLRLLSTKRDMLWRLCRLAAILRGISVSFDRPSDGFTIRDKPKMFNPIYPGSTPESVLSAWNYALDNIRKEMKISLAGPIADARFLGGEPLRLRGADEDRLNCLGLSKRLNILNDFYRGIHPIPIVQGHNILNQVRISTEKWIARPAIWSSILALGIKSARVGTIDSSAICYLIGVGEGFDPKRQLSLGLS